MTTISTTYFFIPVADTGQLPRILTTQRCSGGATDGIKGGHQGNLVGAEINEVDLNVRGDDGLQQRCRSVKVISLSDKMTESTRLTTSMQPLVSASNYRLVIKAAATIRATSHGQPA